VLHRHLIAGIALGAMALLTQAATPQTSTELFTLTQVWNATLSFSAGQWEAIQPEETQPGPGGRGPSMGGRGPGGPRGPGFGPGNFLAGGFLNALDGDKDGQVSRAEFTQGFARWYADWDTQKSDSLGSNELRLGLSKTLMSGGPGGPGMGGPGLQARAGARNGMSGAGGIHFEYVEASLKFEDTELPKVAVRYKGNGTYMDSRNSDKKSLKLDLNEFTKKQKLGGVTKLNFHNNITDPGWMNEPLAHQLYRDAGVPAPRSSYARVHASVAGTWTHHYLGLYSVVENPDNTWAQDRFGTRKGLILKPVTRSLFDYQGEKWDAYQQAYDPKTDITEKQKRRVIDFAKLITQADDAELARRLPEFLDIDEFVRFLAVTVWLSNTDSILMIGQNYIVYLHPEKNQFLFAPWDLDRAFGNFFSPSPEELSIRQAWGTDNRFLERVMKVEAVKKAYLARMAEFQDSIFRPERLAAQVDSLSKILRPAIAAEAPAKATRFDQVVAGERPAPENKEFGGPGGPGGFGMPPAPPIKAFAKARHQSVADQLAGKSEGQPLGGGPGGPGGRRRPGGPGGPGGPADDFGPGTLIAPAFLKAADGNNDGKVSSLEFQALANRWFQAWDPKKSGSLQQEDLANGLNAVIPLPQFGPPGG
jgi:hypothetical protein